MNQKHSIPFAVFTIDDLYTDGELDIFLNYVKNSSDKNRTFTNSPFKNGKMIEPEMSKSMYEKISKHLPGEYKDTNNRWWSFQKSVKYIFYSQINQGQMFGIHTDTGSEYNEKDNLYSKFTVLTYLNDDYQGGHTTFYDDNFRKTAEIIPKRGRTLIFDIDLYHQGEKVVQGMKYWIGTELVCYKENDNKRVFDDVTHISKNKINILN